LSVAEEEVAPSAFLPVPSSINSYRSRFQFAWKGTKDSQPVEGQMTVSVEHVLEPRAMRMVMTSKGTGIGEDVPEHLETIQVGEWFYVFDGTRWMRFPYDASQKEAFREGFVIGTEDLLKSVKGVRRVLPDETVNGVKAQHYRFDKQALTELGEEESFLGQIEDVEGHVWVSAEERFIVRFTMKVTGKDVWTEGMEGTLDILYEVYDLNQPLEIQPPPVEEVSEMPVLPKPTVPELPEDIPLPPEGEVATAVSGVVTVLVSKPLKEVVAFYQEAFPENGWVIEGEPIVTESVTTLTYTKGDRSVTVVISPAPGEPGKTQVMIMLPQE